MLVLNSHFNSPMFPCAPIRIVCDSTSIPQPLYATIPKALSWSEEDSESLTTPVDTVSSVWTYWKGVRAVR